MREISLVVLLVLVVCVDIKDGAEIIVNECPINFEDSDCEYKQITGCRCCTPKSACQGDTVFIGCPVNPNIDPGITGSAKGEFLSL